MRRKIQIKCKSPQLITMTNLTYAQVDSWYGHCVRDLKLDIIYPEDNTKKYPCVVWICGGAWLMLDKSAHLAYLSKIAQKGFVVASVEYRTSNEIQFPGQLEDVKAAIRYLKAHSDRFNIDTEKFATMGESAGGYLASMAALATDTKFDVGAYTEYSSRIQASIPWYPPTDFTNIEQLREAMSEYESDWVPPAQPLGVGPESLLFGKDVKKYPEEAKEISPVNFVTESAPPMMIIHGTCDHTVPFSQGETLYELLIDKGCDATLIEIEDADHADLRFFQDEIWEIMIEFLEDKLKQ